MMSVGVDDRAVVWMAVRATALRRVLSVQLGCVQRKGAGGAEARTAEVAPRVGVAQIRNSTMPTRLNLGACGWKTWGRPDCSG